MQSKIAAWIVLALVVAACSKDGPESPRAEPSSAPQSSAAPQPSVGTAVSRSSSVSKERSSPPNGEHDYQLFRGASGRVHRLEHAALICEEPCRFPEEGRQRVWLVRDGHAEPADQLWPRAIWGQYADAMRKAKLHTRVTFHGDYPGDFYAWGAVESRSGEGNLPLVKWASGAWQRSAQEHPQPRPQLPSRKYDAALLSSPVSFFPLLSFAYGAGAPAMTSDQGKLIIHDGKSWHSRPAPWPRLARLTRLADGNTLALAGDAWLVSPTGRITALGLEKSVAASTVDIGGDAWILGEDTLLRPSATGRFELAPLPQRTSSGRPPIRVEKIANPTDFDASCKTPVVVTGHRDGLRLFDSRLASLFAEDPGGGEGLEIYMVDFWLGQRSVVQAKDLAAARRWMNVLRSHPDLQGELECSDLRSLLPDPYARTEHLRRVFVHARSGLPLDLP